MLFNGDHLCDGPINIAPGAISPHGVGFVVLLFPAARSAVVAGANRVEAMGVTIPSHAM